MVETYKTQTMLKTDRLIGCVRGKSKGPTLVFFGGIHGNEQAGVTALEHVFESLESYAPQCKGVVYGIRANLPALAEGKRYLENDLNRLWTSMNIEKIKGKAKEACTLEELELLSLYKLISTIVTEEEGPFYFIDYHTTSSRSKPFITINDALINRRFSKLFPVPIILGIEEYLEGPLLSYINQKGYVSLGFESGQHTEKVSIKNSVAFTWLTLAYSGFLSKALKKEFKQQYRQLQHAAENDANFYEIIYRHAIVGNSDFKMMDGYASFEKVDKGTPLALENETFVRAENDAIIFMPLYQEQGQEGFFLIRRIPLWALGLSTIARRTKIGVLLPLLPGVSWTNQDKESLLVNTKIAQFFTKPFFHLLGYRNRVLDSNFFVMNNRELTAKNKMYSNTWWYRLTTNKFF